MAGGTGKNIAGCNRLTFHIRGDKSQELYVQLVDHHVLGPDDIMDEPHFSQPVPLIAGGYLRAITSAYQPVSIPLSQLLPRGVYFLRLHTVGVAISTREGGAAGTYYLSRVRVEP